MKDYQKDFSLLHPEIYLEGMGRAGKAEKMLRILRDAIGPGMRDMHVLDIGCSTGSMCMTLAGYFDRVTGIDIDQVAIEHAIARHGDARIHFRLGDAMQTGLQPDSVDAVICAHVYEHVPDPARMMAEIRRILRPGGVCYFAAENRLVLREGDYRLPLLSLLPKWLAHRYVRMAGKADHYYETLLTYPGLLRLTSGFERIDYTRRVVDDPEAFAAADMLPAGSLRLRAARLMVRHAYWLFPDYLWVLRKPAA